jgi:hypothetical protein
MFYEIEKTLTFLQINNNQKKLIWKFLDHENVIVLV